MNNDMEQYYLVQLHFDVRRLFVGTAKRRLPLNDADLGYLIHCQLAGMFGSEAPKPFAIINEKAGMIPVLGYVNVPAKELREISSRFGTPDGVTSCDLERLSTRSVPVHWPPQQRVGFTVRACPIRRMASDGPTWKKGSEVDVFLAECWKAGAEARLDREQIYVDWLRQQLELSGTARLDAARVIGVRRERLFRRAGGAPGPRVERSVVDFDGELTILDSRRFLQLVRRGIGRHRAFGFGMLLLKSARRPC